MNIYYFSKVKFIFCRYPSLRVAYVEEKEEILSNKTQKVYSSILVKAVNGFDQVDGIVIRPAFEFYLIYRTTGPFYYYIMIFKHECLPIGNIPHKASRSTKYWRREA